MKDFILSQDAGPEILKALGLPRDVTKLEIIFEVDSIVTVKVEYFPEKNEYNSFWKTLKSFIRTNFPAVEHKTYHLERKPL